MYSRWEGFKKFPKNFIQYTEQGNDSYPEIWDSAIKLVYTKNIQQYIRQNKNSNSSNKEWNCTWFHLRYQPPIKIHPPPPPNWWKEDVRKWNCKMYLLHKHLLLICLNVPSSQIICHLKYRPHVKSKHDTYCCQCALLHKHVWWWYLLMYFTSFLNKTVSQIKAYTSYRLK